LVSQVYPSPVFNHSIINIHSCILTAVLLPHSASSSLLVGLKLRRKSECLAYEKYAQFKKLNGSPLCKWCCIISHRCLIDRAFPLHYTLPGCINGILHALMRCQVSVHNPSLPARTSCHYHLHKDYSLTPVILELLVQL